MEMIEIIQYQAALTITGTWRGTSRNKMYEELGWESLPIEGGLFIVFLVNDDCSNLLALLVGEVCFVEKYTIQSTGL